MKVLVQPYTHTLSHVSRPLAVAKILRDRGHEVVFAGQGDKAAFIEEEGFQVVEVYETPPDKLYGNIRSGKLRFVSDDEVVKLMEADIELYKNVRPDVVLTDGRFSAPISSHIAGLKHAAIVNVSSTEYRALPYVPFSGRPDSAVQRSNSMANKFNLWLEMLVFDNVMNIFKKLSKKHGVKKHITATNCLTGKDLTLLADIPEYFPTRCLPKDYIYIGPITWNSPCEIPPWWESAKKCSPLVYFTMGSTGVEKLFNDMYRHFVSQSLAAIITTGGQKSSLHTIDGQIYVEPYLDGDSVMEICDLVICHGGNGTIYQALQHGKPVIGIPTIPDQEFNMRRVEALGVGKRISPQSVTADPGIIIQAINEVLSNKNYRENAGNYMKILGTYDGPKTAADSLERMLLQGNT